MPFDKLTNIGLLIMRVMIGLMFATHGYQKIFGGRMEGFTGAVESMGFPAPALFAYAAALSELVGGVLIALGLGTRIMAIFAAVTMFVAAFVAHAQDPFDVKEKALVFLAFFIGLVFTGAGQYSLDAVIAKKFSKG